jgi:hypothetical protein
MHTSRLWHAEYTETAMSVDKSAQSVCVDAPDTPEVELCLFYERPFFFQDESLDQMNRGM